MDEFPGPGLPLVGGVLARRAMDAVDKSGQMWRDGIARREDGAIVVHAMKARLGGIVVYAKEKVSEHPGPRARNVRPARHGDLYHYEVDKYWVVSAVGPQGLHLRTARGKTREVASDDPHLRRLTLREWLWLHLIERGRLRELERQASAVRPA